MRINQNISAMNTYSRLTAANTSKSNSLAKLSSGLRINKAGDDAAGLAISEKMRGQVGGLKQAIRNAQDGISLIQTAEGALTETHSILQRMRELAVQASTDTNTFEDRKEIQNEIDKLATELTRISTDTEFNTMKLLNGDRADNELTFHIGANSDQNLKLKIGDMSARALGVAGNGGPLEQATEAYLGVAGQTVLKSGDEVVGVKIAGETYAAADVIKTKDGNIVVAEGTKTITDDIKTGIAIDGKIVEGYETDVIADYGTNGDGDSVQATVLKNSADEVIAVQVGTDWYAADDVELVADDASAYTAKANAVALDINIGALYLQGTEGGIDVTSQASADKAITEIDKAINLVSAERSKLGATQNRLDHTINNLTATAENLSAAESRIRDVDMAEEMMEFTKNNILSQAATSMLAQANQMPQSVLQLLQ